MITEVIEEQWHVDFSYGEDADWHRAGSFSAESEALNRLRGILDAYERVGLPDHRARIIHTRVLAIDP